MKTENIIHLYRIYTGPGRYYHGIEHIENCFKELALCPLPIDNREGLSWSLWYHDYDMFSEDQSAQIAYDAAIEAGFSGAFATSVKNMILVTKHDPLHNAPITNDEKIICDVDLASLGASPEQFQKNTDLIRKEYAHVSDKDFAGGRKLVLQSFLNRPRIYYTDYFFDKYEAQAQDNLKAAVANFTDVI